MSEYSLKKLLYLAQHRSTKEADIILGKFFENLMKENAAEDKTLLYNFLMLEDHQILAALYGVSSLENPYKPLIQKLKQFVFQGGIKDTL